MIKMRGNPLVELVAILVMLTAVLVGGSYWGVYKQAQQQIKEIRQDLKNTEKKPVTFEQAHKRTE